MDTNTDPVRALIAKWRRQAAEHGARTFTGNDHALFANELEAALAAPLGVEGEARRLYAMAFNAIAEDGTQEAEEACIRAIEAALAAQQRS